MAFNTNVTRFNWVSSIFPCCQARNGGGRGGGYGGRRAGKGGPNGLAERGSYACGDLDISSPSSTLQSKTVRFYGMQPFPDPIVSKRCASPFSDVESDYTFTTASSSSAAMDHLYGHGGGNPRTISIMGVDHYLGAGIPRELLGEKLERLLGENLTRVPEDEVCDNFQSSNNLQRPTTYLLSISSKGHTTSLGSGMTSTDLDGGLELIVQGTDQMDGFDSNSPSNNLNPDSRARPQTSYTATFLLDDINGGSQAALADFLKNLSRQSTDNSTLASRTTSTTEWVLQPLRPAPRSVSPSGLSATTMSNSTMGASTDLAMSGGGSRGSDMMMQRRATLRRRDTGSTLELKLINIEKTPSKSKSRSRRRGDSAQTYTSTETPPSVPPLPPPKPPRVLKRPPPVQLPDRGLSVTAVARRGNEEDYKKAVPVQEKRRHRCGCGRSPRLDYHDPNAPPLPQPPPAGGSRVQSWVVGQQKYYRVKKRNPGGVHSSDPSAHPTSGNSEEEGSRYPFQTGEYELLSPRSLFFEASPSLAEPSPAYTGSSHDNIILSLSPKPVYPCPCYEEAPEYQEVDPNPSYYSRSTEKRKSYIGYYDKA